MLKKVESRCQKINIASKKNEKTWLSPSVKPNTNTSQPLPPYIQGLVSSFRTLNELVNMLENFLRITKSPEEYLNTAIAWRDSTYFALYKRADSTAKFLVVLGITIAWICIDLQGNELERARLRATELRAAISEEKEIYEQYFSSLGNVKRQYKSIDDLRKEMMSDVKQGKISAQCN
jgi:hypothetical protein